jgi:hypothetical protein
MTVHSESKEDSEDSGGATGLAQHSRKRPFRAPARAKLQDSDIESEEDSDVSRGATTLVQRYKREKDSALFIPRR